MAIIVILSVAAIVLFVCICLFLTCYEDYLAVLEENRRVTSLLEECFLMQNDSLEAYRQMLDAACHEEIFRNADSDHNEADF